MTRRKITPADGVHALTQVRTALEMNATPARHALATAVRYLLEELAHTYPGNTVELRVPPFGAVQCVAGPKHTRGTPPNVVEMPAEVWVPLAVGDLSWAEATHLVGVTISGTRTDLSHMLPLGNFAGSGETIHS